MVFQTLIVGYGSARLWCCVICKISGCITKSRARSKREDRLICARLLSRQSISTGDLFLVEFLKCRVKLPQVDGPDQHAQPAVFRQFLGPVGLFFVEQDQRGQR